ISLLFTFSASAQLPESEIRELFEKYDRLMAGEKQQSKEVFTYEFLQEFDAKGLNYKREKSDYVLNIQQGSVNKNLFFVKRVFDKEASDKNAATFIIVKEKNSWRIQGTISDDL
ncbi:MAG: hypothetical protein LW878_09940, partial [Proteobacteria bacterium]|nr:hypothetical protein [Pseudomonadota bacterium]